MRVELWSDGSGRASGPIGWAFVLRAVDEETGEVFKSFSASGGGPQGTNNRAEMTAVMMGLLAMHQACAVTLYTDSEYVAFPFSKGWLATWMRAWATGKGQKVKNRDLWEEIAALALGFTITAVVVPGHDPAHRFPLNDRCDQLAGAARRVWVERVAAVPSGV